MILVQIMRFLPRLPGAFVVVGLGMLLVLAYMSAPLSHVPTTALAAVIEVSLPDAEASDKRLFEATAGGRPCAN